MTPGDDNRCQVAKRCTTAIGHRSHASQNPNDWRLTANKPATNHSPAKGIQKCFLNQLLIKVKTVADTLTLFLVTSLPHTAEQLSELYRHRGDVEVEIRNLKVVLNTERIQAKSVEMFHQAWLTSLVADNWVTQFRRQAAALIAEPPRRMSFKRTWTTFHIFLWSSQAQDSSGWRAKYRPALRMATPDKLPHRPGRSFKREAYARRPKSTPFKKRKPKTSKPKTDS